MSVEQLNNIVTELREKVNELLMTPYAIELLLVILPSLLDAKKLSNSKHRVDYIDAVFFTLNISG